MAVTAYMGTRNKELTATASEAIVRGICPDGGLYIPQEIPKMDRSPEELLKMDYRQLAYEVLKLYLDFMAIYVRKVVESIDVGGMITDKLRLMEPQAVEALILSVVNKEFRYVVWLGGLLGAIIGTINIFI